MSGFHGLQNAEGDRSRIGAGRNALRKADEFELEGYPALIAAAGEEGRIDGSDRNVAGATRYGSGSAPGGSSLHKQCHVIVPSACSASDFDRPA